MAKLNKTIISGNRLNQNKFEYNKDAGMYVCQAGHMAIRKGLNKAAEKYGHNPREVYYFDVEKCKICQHKEGCYKEEAKNGEIKGNFGYDQCKTEGLCGMQIQGALTLFAVNLKRIIKLSTK